VDLTGVPPFEQRVYALLREVGPGATITYGELAERAGSPGAARAVGAAMGRNPVPVIIPCHRVLAGGGRSGGFSAPGGVSTKFRLLEIERASRTGGALLFDELPLAVRN
jgi:methylated-DNA-[protein]-cysteine S-methyltransferase